MTRRADSSSTLVTSMRRVNVTRIPRIMARCCSSRRFVRAALKLDRHGGEAVDRIALHLPAVGGQVLLEVALLVGIMLSISFALAFIIQRFVAPHLATATSYAWVAYLTVFLITLLSNLTIVAPVPIASSRL